MTKHVLFLLSSVDYAGRGSATADALFVATTATNC